MSSLFTRPSLWVGKGARKEERLHSMIFSLGFHGNGSGSRSELSQWTQQQPSFTITQAFWPHWPLVQTEHRAPQAATGSCRAFLLSAAPGTAGGLVGEAASEGQSQRNSGYGAPFLSPGGPVTGQPSWTPLWELPACPTSLSRQRNNGVA